MEETGNEIMASGWLEPAVSPVLAFQTIDDSVYFPRVAQGHHGDKSNNCYQISGSQLTMYNQAKIQGLMG